MNVPGTLDLSREPVVILNLPFGTPDRVSSLHGALEWLIARGVPFVLVAQADDDEAESADERKERALWFKDHAASLAAVCKGFVYVEPNDAKREIWQERAKAMAAAFPVPMTIVADFEGGTDVARNLAEAVSIR